MKTTELIDVALQQHLQTAHDPEQFSDEYWRRIFACTALGACLGNKDIIAAAANEAKEIASRPQPLGDLIGADGNPIKEAPVVDFRWILTSYAVQHADMLMQLLNESKKKD